MRHGLQHDTWNSPSRATPSPENNFEHPADPVDATPCGVTDGVLSDDGFLCCPAGCGTCGGLTCSSVPMSWVIPGDTPLSVDPSVPDGATSAGEYTKSQVQMSSL